MDVLTDTDADADEQNDVLKTLSEQEMSISELVRRVLSQVQSEFTMWNVAHCHEALTSFTASSTWQSCLHPDLRPPSLASMAATPTSPHDARPVVPEANSTLPLVSQQVYSLDGEVTEISSATLEIIHISSSVEPHPPYESCSPLHRSVFKGDDSDNMDFIPYADDHAFDQTSHTKHYGSFSWQDTFDSDCERRTRPMIVRHDNIQQLCSGSDSARGGVQTADSTCSYIRRNRELQCLAAQITLATWDTRFTLYGSKARPLALGRKYDPDVLYFSTLNVARKSRLPQSPQNLEFALLSESKLRRATLQRPRLRTVEPNPMPLRSLSPLSRVLGGVTSPCRNQCFINNEMKEASPWVEADLDMFRAISEMSPNTTPCDLAELCLKPCYEVSYYRKLLCSEEAQHAGIKSQRRLRFNDKDPTQFTPNDPCHHIGSCSSSSSCPCSRNQSHCQRNCRCSPECNRRWQGCRCSKVKSKWSCVTERCPCVEALRECDPELCMSCRCIADDTPCRNSQIQRGARKKIEVKKSSWGLGTFLTEAANTDDLITEYVGEIIYEPTVESRADLATHRDRCYVFGLNNTFSLDATNAGNISRFIDHSDAGQSNRVNSQARVRLVNGDHRIGIFAIRDMEAGSEILMNYGSRFFIK